MTLEAHAASRQPPVLTCRGVQRNEDSIHKPVGTGMHGARAHVGPPAHGTRDRPAGHQRLRHKEQDTGQARLPALRRPKCAAPEPRYSPSRRAAQARSPLGGQGAPAPARHRPPLPSHGNPDRLLHDRQRIRPATRLRPAPIQEVHPIFRSPLHPARHQRGRPQTARRARRHQDPDRLRPRRALSSTRGLVGRQPRPRGLVHRFALR